MSDTFPTAHDAPRQGWRAEVPFLAAFVPLAVAFTWPLAAHLGDRLAGDRGDAWQNLWNFEWIRRALLSGENPWVTHDLWHPDGVTLVFQTFDFPDAIWSMPLRAVFGPWAVYDLVVLATFALSGMSMYALGRQTGSSRWASFFSGCAYTFSTYHFGHALGHLHILAMQWVPLYVLAFWRVLEGGRWRWAFLGGALLVLCSLASWYYLFGAFILSVGLLLGWLVKQGLSGIRTWGPRALVLCGTYLVLILPLGVAMLRVRATEPIAGEHSAHTFSADVQSFLLPNAASALAVWSKTWKSWSGNGAENATYLGYLLVLLAVAGLLLKAPRVGSYLLAAALGIALSLGPALKFGGRPLTNDVLPYAQLVKAFPLLSFTGVPVRMAFAATFGLAAALAPALDALATRIRWKWLWILPALAVLEHVPHAFVTSEFPTPEPMRAWAKDPAKFAVLDSCRDMRPLWHQTIHQHPIMGGYLTRTPARLEDKLHDDPIAGPLMSWDPPTRTAPLSAKELDFPFEKPVSEGAEATRFSLELAGTLQVPEDGEYTFAVESDDAGTLLVDGRVAVDNGGEHPPQEKERKLALTKGPHPLVLRYRQSEGGALVRVRWSGPGFSRKIVGADDVPEGFTGQATFRRRETALSREEALAHLHALAIRYLVLDHRDSRYLPEVQLGLPLVWDHDDVAVFEVPP